MAKVEVPGTDQEPLTHEFLNDMLGVLIKDAQELEEDQSDPEMDGTNPENWFVLGV